MTSSPRLGFAFLAESQAGNATTANTALYYLENLLTAAFKSRALTTPPGSPADGDVYLVPAGATGSWAGQTGKMTMFVVGMGWIFATPKDGLVGLIVDEGLPVMYAGGTWVGLSAGGSKIWSFSEVWTGATEGGSKIWAKVFVFSPMLTGLSVQAHGIGPPNPLDMNKRATFEGYSTQASGNAIFQFPMATTSPAIGLQVGSCGFDSIGNIFVDLMGSPIPIASLVIRAEYFRVGL